jgi:hypothetical protein
MDRESFFAYGMVLVPVIALGVGGASLVIGSNRQQPFLQAAYENCQRNPECRNRPTNADSTIYFTPPIMTPQ